MGRTMPYECEHGRILDWGDFGGEDSKGEECAECTAESDLYLAGVLRARGAVVILAGESFPPDAIEAMARGAFKARYPDGNWEKAGTNLRRSRWWAINEAAASALLTHLTGEDG